MVDAFAGVVGLVGRRGVSDKSGRNEESDGSPNNSNSSSSNSSSKTNNTNSSATSDSADGDASTEKASTFAAVSPFPFSLSLPISSFLTLISYLLRSNIYATGACVCAAQIAHLLPRSAHGRRDAEGGSSVERLGLGYREEGGCEGGT